MKFNEKTQIDEFIWPVGKKYNNRMLCAIPKSYLRWVVRTFKDGYLKNKVIEYLDNEKIKPKTKLERAKAILTNTEKLSPFDVPDNMDDVPF